MASTDSPGNSDILRAVVFHPGPMGIFEQSLALQERGWLGKMIMDYYCDLSSPPYKWIPEGRLKKYLRKRYHSAIDSRYVKTYVSQAIKIRAASHISAEQSDVRTLLRKRSMRQGLRAGKAKH
jgi:hypothetical protein